jgi:hypothetical protein
LLPTNGQRKISGNFAQHVTRQAPPRIYQNGRDNLFNVRFQERRTALGCRARQFRIVPPMIVITLLAVGLLGDAFMLYALSHWMRDGVLHRNR